jgi:acetyl-CoA carboxylase biotin carboxyl carrier protein
MKVSVRRSEEPPAAPGLSPGSSESPEGEPVVPARAPSSLVRVEAPMVGTFYRAPEPGAPPYVQVGDIVVAGQTLCILEAMKLMNEIKAEAEGQVQSILVENAEPVEYGQVLFELEPVDGRPPVL